MTSVVFFLVAVGVTSVATTQEASEQARSFQLAIQAMETRGEFHEASRWFERASLGPDRELSARALFRLGTTIEHFDARRATAIYRRLLREFPERSNLAERARDRLDALRPSELTDLTARRVVESTNLDVSFGSPFPDGTGFTSIEWMSGNLSVYDAASNENRTISNDAEGDFVEYAGHSTVARDGRIAYAWNFPGEERHEIRLVNRDGSGHRLLVHDEALRFARPDGFNGDGSRPLAFLEWRDGRKELALINVSDGRITFTKETGDAEPLEATVSPDARHIVYDAPQENGSSERDLFVVSVDGGTETRLVAHPANDLWPEWTPDGRGVLFYSNRSGVFGLWFQEMRDGAPVGPPDQLRQEMGKAAPLGFAEDGSYYYALVSGSSDIFLVDYDPSSGRVQGDPSLLDVGYTGRNLSPTWSPDGRCLAYLSMQQELFVVPVSHRIILACNENGSLSFEQELDPGMESVRALRWSPDGRSLLVMGRDAQKRWGLHLIDARMGDVEPLVLDDGAFSPSWSPDGDAVMFKRRDPESKTSPLVRLDLESRVEHELFRGSGSTNFANYALSPTGDRLLLTLAEMGGEANRLEVLDVDSGHLEELWTAAPRNALDSFWSRDGETILLVTGPYDLGKERALLRLRPGSREPIETGLRAQGLREPELHPDGNRIAFVSGWLQAKTELWVLENLLPERSPAR